MSSAELDAMIDKEWGEQEAAERESEGLPWRRWSSILGWYNGNSLSCIVSTRAVS